MNLLIFPSTSEIANSVISGLENHHSLNIVKASSKPDLQEGCYYLPPLGELTKAQVKDFIVTHNITGVIPTNDDILLYFAKHFPEYIVGTNDVQTQEICRFKNKTYDKFKNSPLIIPIPYADPEAYPKYLKPNSGNSSKFNYTVHNKEQEKAVKTLYPHIDFLIQDYIEGPEYTIDCVSDHNGQLKGVLPRKSISRFNGISNHTQADWKNYSDFFMMAHEINSTLNLKGVWFFQLKGGYLLEVGPRFSGGSNYWHAFDVNLPLLNLYVFKENQINFIKPKFSSTPTGYKKLSLSYPSLPKITEENKKVWVDWDDTLIYKNKLNGELWGTLIELKAKGLSINILSRSKEPHLIYGTIERLGIDGVFSKIKLLSQDDPKKHTLIKPYEVLIDDSYSERGQHPWAYDPHGLLRLKSSI